MGSRHRFSPEPTPAGSGGGGTSSTESRHRPLPRSLPSERHGQISLVLTSPPHWRTMHGRVEHRRVPLTRFPNTHSRRDTPYGINRAAANLDHLGTTDLPVDLIAGAGIRSRPTSPSWRCRRHRDAGPAARVQGPFSAGRRHG